MLHSLIFLVKLGGISLYFPLFLVFNTCLPRNAVDAVNKWILYIILLS
jgi:hypothetical protein